MNIIVCIKQVPDTTEVRINPQTGTLIRDGIPSIMNPDDKAGLEVALRLKDKYGAVVTVVTMGPLQADKVLREAFAMGADRAVLLSDRAFSGADTWATSSTIAAAIEKLDYDLIIAGRQAIDGDTAQVGPQIAEHLHVPNVSYVEELDVDGDSIIVKRQFEDRYHVVKVKTPCLVTVLSEINVPRYMTPGGIFSAYDEKEVEIWTLDDVTITPDRLGLKGSPTQVKKSFAKSVKAPGSIVKLNGAEAADYIIEKLQEKFII